VLCARRRTNRNREGGSGAVDDAVNQQLKAEVLVGTLVEGANEADARLDAEDFALEVESGDGDCPGGGR
jgi:hypothetical protein